MIDGVTTYGSTELIEKLQNCSDPVFLVTIGTTETSKIPGISGAGASPELTEFTPASDVEFMVLGEVRCTDAAAETVVGDAAAPTPARLTKAALQVANIPFVIIDAGSKVKPDIEYVSLGKEYGRDIRTGKGILNPLEIKGFKIIIARYQLHLRLVALCLRTISKMHHRLLRYESFS